MYGPLKLTKTFECFCFIVSAVFTSSPDAVLAGQFEMKQSYNRRAVTLGQSRPGADGVEAEGRGVRGFSRHKVPHCDKAINVDCVSRWVKSDAVTDSASVCVHVRMCVCVWGVCVAEIIPTDNGSCVSRPLWHREGKYRERKETCTPSQTDQQKLWNWPLYVQRLVAPAAAVLPVITGNMQMFKAGSPIKILTLSINNSLHWFVREKLQSDVDRWL